MAHGKRVALCFSGHVRDFLSCYSSLKEKIMEPLKKYGVEVDIFGAFWSAASGQVRHCDLDNKYRRHGNGTIEENLMTVTEDNPEEKNIKFFERVLQPKVLVVEPFDVNPFVKKFSTRQWMTRPNLSCESTSSDAASMYYLMFRCFEEMSSYSIARDITYDIVCRLRSDLIYDTGINLDEFRDAMSHDVIYIPRWRGRYYEISHRITDYFAFGNFRMMSRYMSTYLNVPLYTSSNEYIHTAEGYLLAQLEGYTTERTGMSFSVRRDGYNETLIG